MPICIGYWMRCTKMNKKAIYEGICPCDVECPIGKGLAAVGGRWKMRIICALFVDGTQRYNDLVRKTTGITNAMLSSSLKELEADGIVTRKQFEEIPPRVEYSLTEHGRELWPILHRLAHWAKGETPDEEEDELPEEAWL